MNSSIILKNSFSFSEKSNFKNGSTWTRCFSSPCFCSHAVSSEAGSSPSRAGAEVECSGPRAAFSAHDVPGSASATLNAETGEFSSLIIEKSFHYTYYSIAVKNIDIALGHYTLKVSDLIIFQSLNYDQDC